jgi:hypothetical protein
MKLKKLYSLLSASLVSVAISNLTSAQAASITFDFFSTSASGVKGKIVFDDSVTPLNLESRPTVATYSGAIQSYSITNGTRSFSGAGINNQINVHNNVIDINDPFNRTYAGDGLEFMLGDGNISFLLRFVYPDSTVLNSLSLGDIFLQKAVASQSPQFPLSSGGAIFTLLQISDFSGLVIQDGTYFGSDFVTSTTVPEPLTIFGTATALGCGVLFKRKSSKKTLS